VNAETPITFEGVLSAKGGFSNLSGPSAGPSVTFTTPDYGTLATPPADATQIMTGNIHAQTATTFSVAALSGFKSLAVSFSGGTVFNNGTGGSAAYVTLYLCGLAAVPAVGAAISTNVYVPITLPSQYTQLTLATASSLDLNVVPVNGFNNQQLNSVVIPYPSSGTLTVWDFCSAGATHTWLSDLTITVTGVL